MVKGQTALWDECLRLIQANVTEQQFKTWFAPIVFESYSEQEHTLMVQVPSPYVYEYLEQYYVWRRGRPALSYCHRRRR